jgi:hypothetical protein
MDSFETCVNWIRMMIRIAKQHEFMKVRAVTVCSKVGIERKAGYK